MRFDRDPDSGLMLPRERRIELARRGLCAIGAGPAFFVDGGPAPETDPDYASRVAGLHMDGAPGYTGPSLTDNSTYASAGWSISTNTLSDAQSKFGGGSLYLNGSTSYAAHAHDNRFCPAAADFYFDLWFRPDSLMDGSTTQVSLASKWVVGNLGWLIDYHLGNLRLLIQDTVGGVYTFSTSTTFAAATWCNLRVGRTSGTARIWKDGTVLTSGAFAHDIFEASGADVRIGQVNATYFPGYIDDWRMYVGAGGGTTNYTPRTTAFPNS